MSAEIRPFPLFRRQAYVRRQAEMIASMRPQAGEHYLRRQLEQQQQVLARKGVPGPVIQRELDALGRAIRAALWKAVLTPGDNA